MASEYSDTFLRDADELLSLMKSDTILSDGEGGTGELARSLHSLKSGASFLGWDDLEKAAHSLEDVLAGEHAANFNWLEAVERLSSLVDARRPAAGIRSGKQNSVPRAIRFTDHERRVLEESRQRGENFYRLTCVIDPSEPLTYPRAYLISTRLESDMTLVKSDPPMDDAEADFSRPTFWFTTDEPDSEIFNKADIDLVKVSELVRIEYSDALSREEIPLGEDSGNRNADDATLIVDRTRYAEAIEIAEELAWRLDGKPGRPESTLSGEMQRTLEMLAYRPLEPMLADIEDAVSRLSERRNLKARFEWTVASGGLDAATLEILTEILQQLVRNALRHGIESPDERRTSGKDEMGILGLHMERTGTSYRFHFNDDGRGIDEDAVMERARREGFKGDLLDVICAPGFSTADDTDLDGGRGLGLEMIRHLLTREFGSELELENRPGRGLSLFWNLPEKHMRRPYLVFVSDGRSWAIPADSVRRRGVMDPGKVNAAGQAYEIGGGLIPLVGPMGLRPPGTVMPYLLEIHHRGRRAALLVDDLLSEEPWGSEELVPSDPVSPWCRSLKDSRAGIPILSPAIVYAADSPSA